MIASRALILVPGHRFLVNLLHNSESRGGGCRRSTYLVVFLDRDPRGIFGEGDGAERERSAAALRFGPNKNETPLRPLPRWGEAKSWIGGIVLEEDVRILLGSEDGRMHSRWPKDGERRNNVLPSTSTKKASY